MTLHRSFFFHLWFWITLQHNHFPWSCWQDGAQSLSLLIWSISSLNVYTKMAIHMDFQTLLSLPRSDINLPTYCRGEVQGGSNMTGTDLYVNKLHCAAAVRPWVKPQPPPSLLLGLEPVQSCLGVARVTSGQKVPRSVEQRIVIKFLVGENVPSAEIHHRLQQHYGEECLRRRHSSPYFPIHTHSGVCYNERMLQRTVINRIMML